MRTDVHPYAPLLNAAFRWQAVALLSEGEFMPSACPQCKDHSQVLHLPEFWKSLPRESELRGKYAQPAEYVAQWLLPIGAVVLGVLLLVSGMVAAGVLLLVGGAGIGFLFSRLASAAEEARERWSRSLYCRRCPAVFPREDAVTG